MDNNQINNKGGNGPKMNMPKFNMNWIYILAILALGLLYFSSGGPSNSSIAKTASYSDFKEMVNHGYAQKIVVNKNQGNIKMYVKPEHIRDVFHQSAQQTGKDPETYLFRIIMLNEDGTWYVDPKSLSSHEEAEATTFSAEITQPPTPQPAAADQVLYYNPDGGSYYHADPNCEAVAEKYRPLSGTFTFGQINEPAYADLKCCQRCAAPMRQNR